MSALDDIRNAIGGSEIKSQLMVAATLTTVRSGAYDPSEPTAGPAKTTTSYPCRAISQKYGGRFRLPSEVRENSFLVTIMLTTLPAGVRPIEGDLVAIPPPGLTSPITARIQKVREVDPAGATGTYEVVGP